MMLIESTDHAIGKVRLKDSSEACCRTCIILTGTLTKIRDLGLFQHRWLSFNAATPWPDYSNSVTVTSADLSETVSRAGSRWVKFVRLSWKSIPGWAGSPGLTSAGTWWFICQTVCHVSYSETITGGCIAYVSRVRQRGKVGSSELYRLEMPFTVRLRLESSVLQFDPSPSDLGLGNWAVLMKVHRSCF